MSTVETGNPGVAQVNQLIRTRRSVFPDQFVPGKTIPDDIVWDVLENANWAPNHKHTEPWRFQVFTGQALQRFAAFQAERFKIKAGDRFKKEKYEKLLAVPPACSHIIVIILRRTPAANLPEMEEMAAVSCAVQNIYLSLAPHGIGGYWSTGGTTFDPAAAEFFGLGPNDVLMGFFYLGYVQVPSPKGTRRPIAEKVLWVKE